MASQVDVRRIGRENRVFSYSADHEPCAVVAPGDRLVVETTNAFRDQSFGPGDTLADLDLEQCDPLTGPLYVEGAAPGDTLAVHIYIAKISKEYLPHWRERADRRWHYGAPHDRSSTPTTYAAVRQPTRFVATAVLDRRKPRPRFAA